MKININSVHFKADKKLEDFITQKVEKVCSKFADVIGSEVTLKLDNTDTPENKIADISKAQLMKFFDYFKTIFIIFVFSSFVSANNLLNKTI